MPRINIYEHSETYGFQVKNKAYACVAFPITAIWGPVYDSSDEDLNPDWLHFEAGYRGTTDFVNTFRGANTTLGARERSYDYAVKLLSAGYDILVKRADGLGKQASKELKVSTTASKTATLKLKAKYPGTFGNQLKIRVSVEENASNQMIGTVEVFNRNRYIDNADKVVSTDQLLEIVSVAFDINAATDSRPFISEAVFSNLSTIAIEKETDLEEGVYVTSLSGATDYKASADIAPTGTDAIDVQIRTMVKSRLGTSPENATFYKYILDQVGDSTTDPATAGKATQDRIVQMWNQQKVFQNAEAMLDELTDPVLYDWDAVFMGIADDQYIPLSWKEANPAVEMDYRVTTTHIKMLEVASKSKCGAAMIGTPFGLKRGTENETTGTGAVKFKNDLEAAATKKGATLPTFGEVVGPWCKTTLPINGANAWITPEVAHLLLIINAEGVGGQNKWWMVPAGMMGTGIVHSPEYRIKKAYLDVIQNHESGVCLNPLMQVPGKGFTCFGNSTLWKKPLGGYNALQNLSTRFLTNRVKERIWDTALQILFKYNNENAYSHFYAGVSPLLDEMKAVGALTSTEANPLGYKIIMNPDIINLDRINANVVIGRVELSVTGVIDTVEVDLFLLPPTAYQADA